MNTQTHTLTWLDKQAMNFEEKRFALMTIYLTVQSCLGGIVAMTALQIDNAPTLIIASAITMGSNALLIAQAPAKWCVIAFYLSIISSALMIAVNLSL